MSRRKLAATVILLTLLAGCSNAVPKCSDPVTVDTVLGLIAQQLDQEIVIQHLKRQLRAHDTEIHHRLEGIATVVVDRTTGAQQYEALLVQSFTQQGREVDATVGRIIEYRSYLSDDGSPYVTVSGDF